MFGMGTGVSFPISSPGSTATGRLKPAAANLLLGSDGCVPFVLAFQPLIRELFVTVASHASAIESSIAFATDKRQLTNDNRPSVATRESVEYMWPSVRPLVPVS